MAKVDAVVGSVAWNLEIYDKGFKQGLVNAQKEIGKFNNGIKEQENGIVRMGKSLVGLAVAYGTFRILNGFLQSSIDKFNQAQLASVNLTNTFLNQKGVTMETVNALKAQAEQLSNTTPLSREQIITAQAVIGTFDGMTASLTQRAIPAFIDYATKQYGVIKTNEQAKAAAESFGKSIVGSTQALTNQGFKFTEAQREILKTGDVTERLKIVIDAMAYASGNASDQAQTMAVRQKILANQFDNAQLAVGGMAQLLKTELLNAFISSSNSGETWGNNMLKLTKQIGTAFVNMANIAGQALIGLFGLANRAAKALGVVQEMKAASQLSGAQALEDGGLKSLFSPGAWERRGIEKRGGEVKSIEELSEAAKSASENIAKLDADYAKIGEQSLSLSEATKGIKDEIEGLTSITDLENIGLAQTGNAMRDMGQEGQAGSEKASEAMKKHLEELKKAKAKIMDFRQAEAETAEKVVEVYAKQKTALADLKLEFDKAINAMKRSLSELDDKFKKSETSARESFLSSLSSAVATVDETIKARELQIQSLENGITSPKLSLAQNELLKLQEEANKASGIEKKIIEDKIALKQQEINKEKQLASSDSVTTQISDLKALNERDRAILEQNSALVEEARKAEEDSKTALSVSALISRFNAEREESKKNYDREKADLKAQLADRESEYAKSQAKIKDDTIKSVTDIETSYLKMFDSLRNELIEMGKEFLALMNVIKVAPSSSKEATDAFTNLLKNIPARAMGGPVMPNNAYLVGEKGPELFVPTAGGNIVPNGGGNTFNININEKADWKYGIDLMKRELGLSGLNAQFGISG